jgi:hypothetical protein
VNLDGKLRAHYPDPAHPEARRPGGICEGSGLHVRAARVPVRDKPDVVLEAETFGCPRCGARPRQPCRTPGGNAAPWPHVGRLEKAG